MTVDGTEAVSLRPADPADDTTIAAAIEHGNRGSTKLVLPRRLRRPPSLGDST